MQSCQAGCRAQLGVADWLTCITNLPAYQDPANITAVNPAIASGDCFVMSTIRRHVLLFSYMKLMLLPCAGCLLE